MNLINICICTYHRNQMLEQCLHSLAKLHPPERVNIRVIVIDNDPYGFSKPVTDALVKTFPFPLVNCREERRGIPFARNKAIEKTIADRADYLVFIDDDEWVEPDWLEALYSFGVLHGGDIIVSGRVISVLPLDTPEEIRMLYNKKTKPSGTSLTACATDNVLIPATLFNNNHLRFNTKNPLAGGTDTIFFTEAYLNGAKILKCSEAIVHEVVPPERTTLTWLSKRKFRAGITVAWRKQRVGRTRVSILLSALFSILMATTKFVINLLLNRKVQRNKSLLEIYRSKGIISGLMGKSINSYQKIDGY